MFWTALPARLIQLRLIEAWPGNAGGGRRRQSRQTPHAPGLPGTEGDAQRVIAVPTRIGSCSRPWPIPCSRRCAAPRVRRTDLERAQCQTLRLRLLRIGAVVTRNTRPTRFGSPAPDPIEPSSDCSYARSPPDKHGPRPPLSRTTTPGPAPERSAALRHANTVPRPLHACFHGAKSPLHPARAGNSGRNLRATGANTPRNRNIRAFTRHPAWNST